MDEATIEIHWTSDQGELAGAIELRRQVFCEEQGVPVAEEIDGRDPEAMHIVAVSPDDGRVIATLRLLTSGERAKIGRVAVEPRSRRQGIALRMLELAVQAAREQGAREAILGSQEYAAPLYEQAGFRVVSERFFEAGLPHVWMSRSLEAEPRESS